MLRGVMFVLYPHPVSYMLNNYIAIHNYREMKYVHEEAELFNSNTVEKWYFTHVYSGFTTILQCRTLSISRKGFSEVYILISTRSETSDLPKY